MTVSILLACYNGEKYIAAQIDSVLSQSYRDFTLYISDDGSRDETLKIINGYATKDSRIKILPQHKPNKSACRHFLHMLQKVSSDIYLFCDQDDVWLPGHVSELVDRYSKLDESARLKPVLVHGDLTVVDGNLNVISESCIKYMNLPFKPKQRHFYFIQNNVTGCVALINDSLRKYVFNEEQNLFANVEKIPMHDMFFASIASEFGLIECVQKPLELYRQHGSNVAGAQSGKNLVHYIRKLFRFGEYKSQLEKYEIYADFFARYFADSLSGEERKILQEFSRIKKHCKIVRILFLLKHGFYKHGIIRNLYLFLSV